MKKENVKHLAHLVLKRGCPACLSSNSSQISFMTKAVNCPCPFCGPDSACMSSRSTDVVMGTVESLSHSRVPSPTLYSFDRHKREYRTCLIVQSHQLQISSKKDLLYRVYIIPPPLLVATGTAPLPHLLTVLYSMMPPHCARSTCRWSLVPVIKLENRGEGRYLT
jgi:hypothetical protein